MRAEAIMFGRYVAGLRKFYSSTLSPAECRLRLAAALVNREKSLLDVMKRGVWQNSASPYRPLFRQGGIEWGDVEALVMREGVDEALRRFLAAGVYVTLDEFKGRRPIVRPGLEIPVTPEHFDNPLLTAHFEGKTGGSGGVRRRLLVDLSLIEQDATAHYHFLQSFGLLGRPACVWRAVPPNNSGIKKFLKAAKLGLRVDHWFSELPTRWTPAEFRYSLFGAATFATARLAGRYFPYPEHVPREKVGRIVNWMAECVRAGKPTFCDSSASAAVRICSFALDNGLDIRGAMFRTGGEPLTPARAAIIERAGARVAAHYSTSETGPIAMACAEGLTHDDAHILLGKMAVIHHPNPGPDESRAGVVYLSTLTPRSPKLMINVDTGDVATLSQRSCGCAFGELGMHQHISKIRSYEKLTSEGILISGSDLTRLVEEVLPGCFGGAPTDYQLVEDQRSGTSRIAIVISPRIGAIEEAVAVETVLSAIHELGPGGRLMSAQLRQAGTFRLLRREPYQTPAAKLMPFFVLRDAS